VLQYLPNPFGLFAIIFGILLTLRKLDVAHRQLSQHPNVSKGDFELWRATAMRAYGFGVWVCFLKIVVDFVGRWAFGVLQPPLFVTRTIGISLEVLWIACLVVTWRKVSAAHRLAEKVGVEQPRDGGQSGLAAGSGGSPPAPPA
jgi:hypothetical protein